MRLCNNRVLLVITSPFPSPLGGVPSIAIVMWVRGSVYRLAYLEN